MVVAGLYETMHQKTKSFKAISTLNDVQKMDQSVHMSCVLNKYKEKNMRFWEPILAVG